jgi:galactokinase
LPDLPTAVGTNWLGYAAGVAWALSLIGVPTDGFDVVVDSDVPVGAGLSSSAALECAVGLGLCELSDVRIDRMQIATAAQHAEREVVGAPVGVMDQAISLLGCSRHALFLDCRSLESKQVLFDLDAHEMGLLVIDTRVAHAHATNGYAERRKECEAAAQALGVAALRDVTADDADRLEPVLARRVRHVCTENDRVVHAAERLREGNLTAVGALLSASHESLRHDFEVSVPELDLAVEAAIDAGAVGARMTGGGFGGAAIALVRRQDLASVTAQVADAFVSRGYAAPNLFEAKTADGARRVEAR